MANDHGSNVAIASDDNFAYKRAAIPALAIAGGNSVIDVKYLVTKYPV
jgi:hypothetical protein